MNTQHFILATAGHVDHGKSALVQALTGTDPDRLPEEKARGITIDLGFAHLRLPSPAHISPTLEYQVGIIDVPGHEDFIKNMVAGMGSIDLAMLVVAADDGWMPQTEEHFQIINYLDVRHAVIALTKIDLAQSEEQAIAQVRKKLSGTPLASAPIIPTSVITGGGLEELKQALSNTLAAIPPQGDIGKPRLPIDRAFTLRGIGTVVTGTLTGGSINRSQSLIVQPSAIPTRARTVQSYNREVEAASPGTRVALNLPDLQIDTGHTAATSVSRGKVVTLNGLGIASDTIDVLLHRSGREAQSSPLLKDGALVHIHHGSGDFPAKVALISAKQLAPGETSFAQLRFQSPVYAFAGDRFIVRDWPAQHTLAGGFILDPDAHRKGFRTEARKAFLETRAAAPHDAAAFVASALHRDGTLDTRTLLLKSRFSAAAISAAVVEMTNQNRAVVAGSTLVDLRRFNALKQELVEAVDAHHRAHPELSGPNLADLRGTLQSSFPHSEVFDLAIAQLCENRFVRAGAQIRRSSHRPALPQHLAPAGTRIRAALAAKPLEPPSRKELAPDAVAQQALRFLLDTGQAIAVGEELVLSADAYVKAIDTILKTLRERGPATVSDLRRVLNTTRRIMMPLLDKLDREGITQRQGDLRSRGRRAT